MTDIHGRSVLDQNFQHFAGGRGGDRYGRLVRFQLDDIVVNLQGIADLDEYFEDIAGIDALAEGWNLDFDCHNVCRA